MKKKRGKKNIEFYNLNLKKIMRTKLFPKPTVIRTTVLDILNSIWSTK